VRDIISLRNANGKNEKYYMKLNSANHANSSKIRSKQSWHQLLDTSIGDTVSGYVGKEVVDAPATSVRFCLGLCDKV
jgi:hypothetical protein